MSNEANVNIGNSGEYFVAGEFLMNYALIGCGRVSPNHLNAAKENGFKTVTLGPRIMRTETAPLACISAVMYELGDW